MNKFFIIGNSGNDVKIKVNQNGNKYASVNVAVHNTKGETTWLNVSLWGKTAENAEKFIKKGTKILIEGSLSSYKSKNGSVLSLIGERFELLSPQKSAKETKKTSEEEKPQEQEELPF